MSVQFEATEKGRSTSITVSEDVLIDFAETAFRFHYAYNRSTQMWRYVGHAEVDVNEGGPKWLPRSVAEAVAAEFIPKTVMVVEWAGR